MTRYTHAQISAGSPRALGTCDRCGRITNLDRLQWQFQWMGPRLQNLGFLVCQSCLDIPQEQLRAITLPQDPPPVANPRVEQYTQDDNPYTALGINIGNMINAGGVNAAFDGVDSKPQNWCASLLTSISSYQNTVGKQWVPDDDQPIPTDASDQRVSVTEFTMYAPSDAPFLTSGAVSFYFQGSSDASTWTTLYSATTAGTAGEILTVDSGLTVTPYSYHQWVFNGNGSGTIAVAQISITGTGLSGNQI